MNDRIISLWKWFWASKTILTPLLFSWNACTKVRDHVYMCYGYHFFLSLFTIFQLDFGIILTVRHFAVFFISLVHEMNISVLNCLNCDAHSTFLNKYNTHVKSWTNIYFHHRPEQKHALKNHSWHSNYNIQSIVCY